MLRPNISFPRFYHSASHSKYKMFTIIEIFPSLAYGKSVSNVYSSWKST